MTDENVDAADDTPTTPTPIMTLPGGKEGVSFLRFSPDGSRLASSVVLGTDAVVHNNSLHRWDIAAQRLEGESLLPERLTDLDISPDWSRLAVASPGLGIELHELGLGREPSARIIDTRPDVRAVAFLSGGELLLAGYADGHASVLDLAAGLQQAAFRPAHLDAGMASAEVVEVNLFAVAPNGVRVAILAADTRGAVQVWDISRADGDLRWVESLLDPEHSVFDMRFSADGQWLAITDGVDNLRRDVVRVFDAASLELVQVLVVPQDIPKALAFSGDGRYLAVAGAAGTVWLWDTRTWMRLGSIAAHVDAWDHRQGAPDWQIGAIAWSAATGVLATGGMDPLEPQHSVLGNSYTGPIKYTIKLWRPIMPEVVSGVSDTEQLRT